MCYSSSHLPFQPFTWSRLCKLGCIQNSFQKGVTAVSELWQQDDYMSIVNVSWGFFWYQPLHYGASILKYSQLFMYTARPWMPKCLFWNTYLLRNANICHGSLCKGSKLSFDSKRALSAVFTWILVEIALILLSKCKENTIPHFFLEDSWHLLKSN